jgi:hypothetical protein
VNVKQSDDVRHPKFRIFRMERFENAADQRKIAGLIQGLTLYRKIGFMNDAQQWKPLRIAIKDKALHVPGHKDPSPHAPLSPGLTG